MTRTRTFQEYQVSLVKLSFVFIHLQVKIIQVFDFAIGTPLNVMRQSVCLVSNPIMVDNYAAFFNYTPVGRASDYDGHT